MTAGKMHVMQQMGEQKYKLFPLQKKKTIKIDWNWKFVNWLKVKIFLYNWHVEFPLLFNNAIIADGLH